MSIPGLDAWLASPAGRHVLDWEQRQIDAIASDIFGFNALQLGLPRTDFLRANRIPLHRTVGDIGPVDVVCDFSALPFAAASTDLAILPHVLEFAEQPHQILREIERIMIPEGQLLIIGFNPLSPWGLRKCLPHDELFPWNGHFLTLNRLKDWLKLLGFEIDRGTLGCDAPSGWWLPVVGRCWSFSRGIYILRAIKRTPGMRLITPNWRRSGIRAKALRPVTQKEGHGH